MILRELNFVVYDMTPRTLIFRLGATNYDKTCQVSGDTLVHTMQDRIVRYTLCYIIQDRCDGSRIERQSESMFEEFALINNVIDSMRYFITCRSRCEIGRRIGSLSQCCCEWVLFGAAN